MRFELWNLSGWFHRVKCKRICNWDTRASMYYPLINQHLTPPPIPFTLLPFPSTNQLKHQDSTPNSSPQTLQPQHRTAHKHNPHQQIKPRLLHPLHSIPLRTSIKLLNIVPPRKLHLRDLLPQKLTQRSPPLLNPKLQQPPLRLPGNPFHLRVMLLKNAFSVGNEIAFVLR